MRWLIILILLAVGVQGLPSLTPLGGGSANQSYAVLIPWWPVYDQYLEPDTINLTVRILNPLEGETYYTNTHNVTANITGNFSSMDCWYRVNGGGWNTYDCVNAQVTFPNENVTLTVMAQDEDGHLGMEDVSFYLRGIEGGGPGGIEPLLLVALGLSVGLVLLTDSEVT